MAEQRSDLFLRSDRRTRRRGAGSASETHDRPSMAPPPPAAHAMAAPRPRSLPSPTADAGLTFAQETSALADRGATTVYPYILRESVSPAELALAAARRELSRQQAWTPAGGVFVGVAAESDVAASHSSLARQSLSEDEARRRLRATLASAEPLAPDQPSLNSPGPDAAAGPTAPSQQHWTDGGSTVGIYAAGGRAMGPGVAAAAEDHHAAAAAAAEAALIAGASTMAAVASPSAFDVTTAATSLHATDRRAMDGQAAESYRGTNDGTTAHSAAVTEHGSWRPLEHQHQHQTQHQVQEPAQEGGVQFVVVDPDAKRELSQAEKDVSRCTAQQRVVVVACTAVPG